MNIRKSLLSFAIANLFGCRPTAWAGWTFVHNGTLNAKIYYDPATQSREGEKVRVWILVDLPFKQSDGSLSLREYLEMNCKEVSYRILQQEKFPEHQTGGMRISGETAAGDWRYIAPDSVDRMILKRVCD